MADIVVVGSINMDLVSNVKEMPKRGETVIGTAFNQIPGGKGANQAVAMARLGGSVAMVGKVGEDSFGNRLILGMNTDGVDTTHVEKIEGSPTGVALIVVDERGENSIVVIPGANYEMKPENIDYIEKSIENCKMVVMQLEIPIDTVNYSLKKAKEKGKYTILNPAPAQTLNEETIKNIDLLTPNETELEILTGISIKNDEDIRAAAYKLMDLGVKELVVTLGEKGCVHVNSKTFRKYNAYKVTPVDATGAGDSFNAGIAVGLSQGMAMDEAIKFALKVGALTVTKRGAQSSLPYLKEVLNFKGEF